MGIKFQKKEEWFHFYDNQGNEIARKTEVRFDPLTGESSRLIFDPGMTFTPPDYIDIAAQTSGAKCPFCPENLLKLTPIFPKEIVEEGRIFQGEAVVFPNLFPYSKHNGVVVLSEQHYVRLEEFTERMIMDAFIAAQHYIQKIAAADQEVRYVSINWNYLPNSGGSVLHPHIHVSASDSPTNYQALVNQKANAHSDDYFTSLYEMEKSLGERWIGEKGSVAWLHAYAPKSQNDFIGIFRDKYTMNDVNEQDWADFADGLQAIFATMSEQGFASFNMVLMASMNGASKQSIHVRLIPRFTMGLLGTSDMNFFQALHQEPLTYKVPEEVAAKARQHF